MKNDFPLFKRYPNIIYCDNAATSQKPHQVITALNDFYMLYNAPVHRGIYRLAEQATDLYEQARATIAQFINAHSTEIVFTSGATEGINIVAQTWAFDTLNEGDEIVLTQLEHHANLLPWYHLAHSKKLRIRYIPITKDGMLDDSQIDTIISAKTKLVSFLDVSNAIGTSVDVAKIVQRARIVGAKVLIDACQSVSHQKVDVQEYDCDFLVFSGHKMFGPTGIGILYIKKELQRFVRSHRLGGGAVENVSRETFSLLDVPHRFQAGTPPIAQAIGLAAAVNYCNAIDMQRLRAHEAQLCQMLIDGLMKIPEIKVIGPINQLRSAGHMVSFIHTRYHHHDVGAYLDKHTICVRTGHYCAQPLAQALSINGSIRVSFHVYNEPEEVDILLKALQKL